MSSLIAMRTPSATHETDHTRLSVIVPAFRCAGYLGEVLTALGRSTFARARWELIVVDDGSDDATSTVATTYADRVLNTGGPFGPAAARNLGAQCATGDVLVFVDSDVVVAADVLARIAEHFSQDATLGALFGSYDAAPRHPSLVSQYRNLLHHFVHHEQAGPAVTFWAGCGAVRASAFAEVGGFDAARYPRPQIEDIELGYRLYSHGGRIVLDPAIQGRHLKHWTLGAMVRTDLKDRAIPWMHLLIDRKEVLAHGPLNLGVGQKIMTAGAGLAVLAPVIAAATGSSLWLLLSLFSVGAIIAGNVRLLVWFSKIRGVPFALGVVPLRVLFYLVSGLGAVLAISSYRTGRSRRVVAPHPIPLDRRVA